MVTIPVSWVAYYFFIHINYTDPTSLQRGLLDNRGSSSHFGLPKGKAIIIH